MRLFRMALAILVAVCPVLQDNASAQQATTHAVSLEELRATVAAQANLREQNIQEVQKLLRHELVQKEVGKLVDLERIEKALPTLDAETLNRLADESRKANDQLRAGLAGKLIAVIIIVAVVLLVLHLAGVPGFAKDTS